MDVCGLDRVHFAGPNPSQAFVYVYPKHERPWVYGGTLCYRKEVWTRNPFADTSLGEDNDFVWNGIEKKIAPLPDGTFYVGLIHGGNTSPKSTWDTRWMSQPADTVMSLLGADWEAYAALLSGREARTETAHRPKASAKAIVKPTALVALGAGIGDILRSTPLIRVMHGLGYEVDVLIETDYPEVVSLFEGAPEIRRLFYRTSHWSGYHGEPHERLRGLAESSYDVAVPPWLRPHTIQVESDRQLHIPEAEWWSRGVSHAIQRLAEEAGWTGALPAPVVAPSASRFDISPDTVALHPGCKPDWPWKKWHGFEELAERLPEVVIIGQPSDLLNHRTYFQKEFVWRRTRRELRGPPGAEGHGGAAVAMPRSDFKRFGHDAPGRCGRHSDVRNFRHHQPGAGDPAAAQPVPDFQATAV